MINEIMKNPSTAEPSTEWFEVKNVSGSDLDIGGCTISDGEDTHTIAASTTVTAADPYFVFGYSNSISGVTVDYVYNGGSGNGANIHLANTSDQITIECGGTTIDSVSYNSGAANGWPSDTEGRSIAFGIPMGAGTDYYLQNDSGSNWERSTSEIGGGNTDTGTPGAKNDDVLGATVIILTSFIAHSNQGIARPEYVLAAVSRWLWLMLGLAAAAGLTILKRRRPI